MTEVPDKESGVTPRRRRRDGEDRPSGRADRAVGPAVAVLRSLRASTTSDPCRRASWPCPVRSSRAASGAPRRPTTPAGGSQQVDGESDVDALPMEDGRRRRRRRGGRGRGRAARPEGDEARGRRAGRATRRTSPTRCPPCPSTPSFGSVWDRQIGVPTERPAAGLDRRGETPPDDELPEPDVPEYLLAERRQQDRRPGPRWPGRAGAGAIDRRSTGSAMGSARRSGFARGGARGSQGLGTRRRLVGPRPTPWRRSSRHPGAIHGARSHRRSRSSCAPSWRAGRRPAAKPAGPGRRGGRPDAARHTATEAGRRRPRSTRRRSSRSSRRGVLRRGHCRLEAPAAHRGGQAEAGDAQAHRPRRGAAARGRRRGCDRGGQTEAGDAQAHDARRRLPRRPDRSRWPPPESRKGRQPVPDAGP